LGCISVYVNGINFYLAKYAKYFDKKGARDAMATTLSNFVGLPLTWVPTAVLKDRYDLIAPDNTTLATLDMSNWSSKATAHVPEGTLFLRKESWTGLKVAITAGEQGPRVASYQRKWTGTSGQLSFPDGRSFTWKKVNFWGTQKAWIDSVSNVPYVQFAIGKFSRKSTVTIAPQAMGIQELSLLVVLGLYNSIVEKRDQAAAASA
jgi:hypothetical protein